MTLAVKLGTASGPHPRGGRISTYLAIAGTAFRQHQSELAVLTGRAGFYVLLLLVFSELWEAAFAAGSLGAPLPSAPVGDYVWYLAVTEWIVLSQPSLHLDVEADVRNGDIAYHLGRPVSYVGSKLAEGAGELGLRLLCLGIVGVLFARIFSGVWPAPSQLFLAAAVGALASVLMLMCLLSIGLCAFWLHDCMPIYMVWQKTLFLLGGLMIPLHIYPDWLRALALATPFAPMLHGPGQLVMTGSPALAAEMIGKLLVWSVLAGMCMVALERFGRRKLEIEGG